MTALAKMRASDREEIPLQERLIVALDVPTTDEAKRLVQSLGSSVLFYKIGLELQFAGGIGLAKELINEGKKVFLDSKLFDIETTVTGAVANVANLGVTFLTIHGNGSIVRAAVKGRGNKNLKLLSVTFLTSLDEHDLLDFGIDKPVGEFVFSRAEAALNAGCDGVIASGLEAESIRKMAGDRLLIVTPGIRSTGQSKDDQKRTATPSEAINAGADYLVMGREIRRNSNPGAKAESIIREIEKALRG